jgi:hypothetical protein
MKKEATPKCKGLKTKTSDEKRGNPKTQGLKTKTSDGKSGNSKMQGAQNEGNPLIQKAKNHWLAEASPAKLTLEGEGDTFWS